jgi:hypothetical protein
MAPLPDDHPALLVLTDVVGAVVARQRVDGHGPRRATLDLGRVAPGLYFLRLVQGNATVARRLCVSR